jgi:single-strand DNA-binding protein
MKMQGFNLVLLMGNLTRDPELRYTTNGMAYCKMGVAVSRNFTNKDGEKKEDVYFANIIVWGRQGENCATYLKKGYPVFVQGRLSMRSYETPEGEKKTVHEIVALNVQFLPRPGSAAGAGAGTGSNQRDEVPAPPLPEEGMDEPIPGGDGMDDDIPF